MQSDNQRTKKIAITVRFSDEQVLNEVRRLAREQHRSMSGQIEHMLFVLMNKFGYHLSDKEDSE